MAGCQADVCYNVPGCSQPLLLRVWASHYLAVEVAERDGKSKECLVAGLKLVVEADLKVLSVALVHALIPDASQR